MRNIRIGVVEDDPASCQLVLDYLNRYQQENGEQFTVSVFDDGARIVEKYTPVYDILLLDIEMSEMDGMAAARRIRERDDKVVIVFITAAPQYAISGYECVRCRTCLNLYRGSRFRRSSRNRSTWCDAMATIPCSSKPATDRCA